MAGPNDFTGQNIQDTYQRVLQVSSSGVITDGTGSLVTSLTGVTASNAITASHALFAVSASHEITFELSSSHAQTADALTPGVDINVKHITASGNISSSKVSTGSFGRVELGTLSGHPGATISITSEINQTPGASFFVGQDIKATSASSRITLNSNAQMDFNSGSGDLTLSGGGTSNTIFVTAPNTKFSGHVTASGNISASGDLISNKAFTNVIAGKTDGTGIILGSASDIHVTASGNISASGNIIGTKLTGTNKGDQDLSNLVTNSQTSSFVQNSATSSFVQNSATSSFALTTDVVANSATSSFITNLQTASFAITGSDVEFGNITASGDISASGNIIVNEITSSGNTKITGELELSNGNIRSSDTFDFLQLGGSAQQINIGKLGMSASYSAANTALSAMATSNAAVFGGDVSIGPSNNGKLGIGMLKPTSSLDITGDLRVSSNITSSGNISASVSSIVQAGSGSFSVLKGNDTTTTGLDVSGFILAQNITASGNITSSNIFATNGVINTRLGIGTTSPGQRLEVIGNISSSGEIEANTFKASGNVDFNGDLDVDGTTNLDVVDIDGTITIANDTKIQGEHTSGTVKDIAYISTGNRLFLGGTSIGTTIESSTANMFLDSAGDITIDADSGNVYFKDNTVTKITFNTTVGHITASGDISSSGIITADSLDIRGQGGLTTFNDGDITNVGSILADNFAGDINNDHKLQITSDALDLRVDDTSILELKDGQSTFSTNITASGTISASGEVFSNTYYQWEATGRADTDDDSNWQGPNSKGLMSNEDWAQDYGTDYDGTSKNAESRLYMNTGWWVPHGANYSASIKSMDVYVQVNTNLTHADDDFFSCSLWYSHNSDLQSELNHVDTNSGTFVQRHGASVDSSQCKASDDKFFKYNNYHVSQSINLDLAPGSMLFPRIKTGSPTAGNNFSTNVYWVIHYCKKPL